MKRILPIIMLLVSSARADYHYASHEGSDEYPYTSWETAADSIQNAIDASSPHDTVYIGAGEWDEVVATGEQDSVAIIGMGIDETFCFSDSFRTNVMTIDYGCSVEEITFQHYNNWKCLSARAYAGVTITECKFIYSHIGLAAGGGPTEISNCIFDSCGTAIFLPVWIGDFHISNNLILNSYDDWAILLQVNSAIVENNIIISSPGAIVDAIAGAPNYATIRNNLVMNGLSGIGTGANQKYNNIAKDINRTNDSFGIAGADGDTLLNNLTFGCRRGILLLSGEGSCTANYNAFWNNHIDIQAYGNFDSIGNIFVNPMLVSNDDFHLQAFSPLIDAGDPDILDLDGSRSDIGFYGGPYGESYEYLDLPPAIPDSLSGEVIADSIILNWRYNTEADFSNYLLYKDTASGFEPSVFNLIAEPDTSYYVDADIVPGVSYYYRIAALDNQGNVSDYSDELEVVLTGIWEGAGAELPRITTIQNNYPNPFNSNTTIIYSVANLGPIPAEIRIVIFDIMGREVRTLIDERKNVGLHRVIWDGKSDDRSDCPSGVYFARISQWGLELGSKPKKLVLVR